MTNNARHKWEIGEKAHVRDVLINGRRLAPCHYCDKPLTRDLVTLDHIVPWSEGGENSSTNLVIACQSCNRRRGTMTYFGFLRLIGRNKTDSIDTEIAALLGSNP